MAITPDLNELSYFQPPPALERIVEKTAELGFDMASEPKTGALLRALAASKPDGRFLELGTGTGMATAWLLEGMDAASKLTSVDTDPAAQAVARDVLGHDARLTLVLKDGLAFLREAAPASFDFVFADAMPGKYLGLQECLNVIRPGGLYVIDDMLEQANWPEGHAAKVPLLLRALADHKDVVIAPLTWASGIVVAVRRG